MDGLALLCNLHADGPLSLRRLRQAGVRKLEHVARLELPKLCSLLEASQAQAKRFVQEASWLAERVYETAESAPEPEPREESATRQAPGTWVLEDGTVVFRTPMAREREQTRVKTLVPSPPAGETPLRPGVVEGLDAATCERLIAHGVRSFELFVELANLSLARRLQMPLTRLLDLQQRARQLLTGRTAGRRAEARKRVPRPQPPVDEMMRVSTDPGGRSRVGSGIEDPHSDPGGAGGPFA